MKTGSGDISLQKIEGMLTIGTGSGDIKSNEICADKIKKNTGSGDVSLQRVQGSLEIDTGSGDIKGNDIRTNGMCMKTGSGDINLSVVQSPIIDLHCASGDVDLDLTSKVDSMTVDAVSGDVTIRATDELGTKVDLKTLSGEINSKLPIKIDDQNDQNAKQAHKKSHGPQIVRGTVGNGSGSIKIYTVSGDIKLLPRGDSDKSQK